MLRYAAAGSAIRVYLLHPRPQWQEELAAVNKMRWASVQPPGCVLPATNGIRLPAFVRCPIEAEDLDAGWLPGWGDVRAAVVGELAAGAGADKEKKKQPAASDMAGAEQK